MIYAVISIPLSGKLDNVIDFCFDWNIRDICCLTWNFRGLMPFAFDNITEETGHVLVP